MRSRSWCSSTTTNTLLSRPATTAGDQCGNSAAVLRAVMTHVGIAIGPRSLQVLLEVTDTERYAEVTQRREICRRSSTREIYICNIRSQDNRAIVPESNRPKDYWSRGKTSHAARDRRDQKTQKVQRVTCSGSKTTHLFTSGSCAAGSPA